MAISLAKRYQSNQKRYRALMKDIRKDVVTRTKNSKDIDTWLEKLEGYATQNPLTTGAQADKTPNLVKAISDTVYSTKLPRGSNQSIMKGVISESTMHLVTRMGDDLKDDLRKIAITSYNNKLAPRDIAKEMSSQIDSMTRSRALSIARTETMRASNLSNHLNAETLGAKSYTVHSHPDCCGACAEIYNFQGTIFDIKDTEYLPPLHPNCRCVPRYSTDPVTVSVNTEELVNIEAMNAKNILSDYTILPINQLLLEKVNTMAAV